MNLQCTFSVLRSLLCRDDSMWAIGECIMLITATTLREARLNALVGQGCARWLP